MSTGNATPYGFLSPAEYWEYRQLVTTPRGPWVVAIVSDKTQYLQRANMVKHFRKCFVASVKDRYRRKDYDTDKGGRKINYMELFACFFDSQVYLNKNGEYRHMNIGHMRNLRDAQPSIKPFIP